MNITLIIIAVIGALMALGVFKFGKKKDMNKGIGAVLAIAAIGFMFLAPSAIPDLFASGASTQSTVDTTDLGSKVIDCQDSTATVTFAAVNAENPGTSVAATPQYRIDGSPAVAVASGGTATVAVGSQLEIFWNASNFLDDVSTYTVPCGAGVAKKELFATSTNTFKITDDSFNTLADRATATGTGNNASDLGTGGTGTFLVKLTGTNDESTGDLVYVVEVNDSVAVADVILSGFNGATKIATPGFYSTNSAGAKTYTFLIPAIVDARTVSGDLTITLQSGKTYTGPVYTTAYSKQSFIETDGNFKYGTENSLNAVKYEDTYDYDFWIE